MGSIIGDKLREAIDRANQSQSKNLLNTIEAWDKDEQDTQLNKGASNMTIGNKGNVTNNVTRETFAFIKNNPGMRASDIVQHMTKRDFKAASVNSIIYQMVLAGLVKTDNGRVTALTDEFKPFSITKLRREKAKREGREVRKIMLKTRKTEEAGIAALPAATTPSTTLFAHNNPAWSAKDLVATLSVVQARELYDELKRIFGGAL